MKKFLLLSISFCLSFISFDLLGQNSAVVTAFLDQDANGIDDDGATAAGLTNAELFLTQVGTGTVFNHVELAAGEYTFGDGLVLPDGDYFLTYVESAWTPAAIVPANAVLAITQLNVGGPTTDNNVDPVAQVSATFTLTGGVTEQDVDLGLYFASAIGDFVWEDIDGNGLSDGEPGIDGVTVTLLDGTGAPAVDTDFNPVPSQNTTGGGNYLFGNIAPGDYIVQFSLPTIAGDWYPTTFDATVPDFANDSDADPNNSLRSPIYSIGPNIIYNENIDAGFYGTSIIGDMVFCDSNGDGLDNDGLGVDGINVELIDVATGTVANDADGNPLTMLSAGGGMYQFTKVKPGAYFLQFSFVAPFNNVDYTFTMQDEGGDDTIDSDVESNSASPSAGQTEQFSVISRDTEEELKWDAGLYKFFTVTGNFWIDSDMNQMFNSEAGPGGVFFEFRDVATDMNVQNGSIDGNGIYEFQNVKPGNYYIYIPGSNFESGGGLNGLNGCLGQGAADDMVDNDDNGSDTSPGDVTSTPFLLTSTCDPSDPQIIEYIDFCFEFDCNEPNNLASGVCSQIADADIICNVNVLGDFCSLMPTGDVGGDQPDPLCPGTPSVANNISWFAFVAYGGTYSVTVTPTGCTEGGNGNFGVQLGLYTDCSFSDAVYCQGDCSTDPITFGSDVLVEGQTYYFFIDGCAGSVCSYEVSIDGTPVPPVLTPQDVCLDDAGAVFCDLADVPTYCPGQEVTFVATGIELTVDFTWSINALVGGPYSGNGIQSTENEEIALTFDTPGVYEVCLTQVDNGCITQQWTGNECYRVNIEEIPDEMFDPVTVCDEDLNSFDPSILVDADAATPTDPNGDGTIGWQGPTGGFTPGPNPITFTVDQDGCMYDQEFILMAHPISPVGMYNNVVCNEDLPITEVDGISINEGNFVGGTTFNLPGHLLPSLTDQNGCDTIVDIMVERLVIQGGGLVAETECFPGGIPITLNYLNSLSSPLSLMTFTWTDPNGMVMNDNFDDPGADDPLLDNIAPTGLNGTYMLDIEIEKDGTICTYNFTVDVDFTSVLPVEPSISGSPMMICESDSIQTYTAEDFGDAFEFDWDVTGGTVQSGGTSADETVTVNWGGVTNGSINLVTSNLCGESTPVNIPISLVPILVPDFSFTADVCQGGEATIEFTGNTDDIDSYSWDFGTGIIDNGAATDSPGPFIIIWDSAMGDQYVTLTVTHNGGCTSEETINVVNVIEPLEAPLVNCNPQTGEVSFTWPDVTGAVSYDVNVTSIDDDTSLPHTGTITGNTFTVTGLADGETVTIELIVNTGDACVSVSSMAVPCTSQNCVAPTITLDAGQGANTTIELCTSDISGNITIVPSIESGETGTGVFSGTGIIDGANGTFDPTAANIGSNNITYDFTTDDDCIGVQTITIIINETPTADFTVVEDTLCILDPFELNYTGTAGVNSLTWVSDDGQPLDGLNPTITFTEPGEHIITLMVAQDDCESAMVQQMVFVEPALEAIDVTCAQQEIDFVTFGWNDVVGATEYIVTVTLADGTELAPFVTTDLSHTENGLTPGDVISINVEVVANDTRCPASSDSQSCTAEACPTFVFNIPNPVIDVCADGTTPLVDLLATASGGDGGGTYTWTGSGNIVNDNQFDPNGLPEGAVTLFVTYAEGGCEGSESLVVNVSQAPVAMFDIATDPICVGSSLPITFTGSNLTGQAVDWSNSEVVVSPGANANEYTATFPSEGTFDVIVEVTNGSVCTPDMMTQSIVVEAELVFGDIDCNEALDQITFTWEDVDCASEYEVFIDNVSQGIQSTTTYTATGLTDGQEVSIEVIAISGCACGNVMQTRMCQARPCVSVELALSPMGGITDFCFEEGLPTVEIMTQETNATSEGVGSWSGTGVSAQGIFDPMTAGIGSHTITYTFIEPDGCQEFTEDITFNIFAAPTVVASAAPIDCYNETMTDLEVVPDGGDGSFMIQLNGEMASNMNVVDAGDYNVLVTDGNGCTVETSVQVIVPAEPMVTIDGSELLTVGQTSNYGIDPSLFIGQTIDSIVWTSNGTVVCNDAACFSLAGEAPLVNTTYAVTVHYNSGCSVSTLLEVTVEEVEPVTLVTIPNVFSPNRDGNNETWKITSNDEDVLVNSIKVYDRWGALVFDVDTPFAPATYTGDEVEWDGRKGTSEILPGVYVYYIELFEDGRERIRKGDITILK